jgi:hypothetical protein
VYSADTCTGEESGGGLPSHGEVYGDGISFLDAETLEDIGNRANLTEKLGIGDETAFTWLIGLIDDGRLKVMSFINYVVRLGMTYFVRVFVCPSINAVVRDIQTAFWEPSDIARFESPGSDSAKRAMPVEGLSCDLGND